MTDHYIGRFAPSPTGRLHFGSMLTAIASFLDAKANNGQWLVRIEDIDTPRVMEGASDDILATLRAFGMSWDGDVVYQHQQIERYQAILHQLQTNGFAYGCGCSRKEVAEVAHAGVEGPVYPGTCRQQSVEDIRAWRFRLPDSLSAFEDLIQGNQSYDLQHQLGDFVLFRADGLVAYQLAVVTDDEAAGVTHIIRGLDLIHSTPRQIALLQALDFKTPRYGHLPLIVATNGQKLSKQNLAKPVNNDEAFIIWHQVLTLLGQQPPLPGKLSNLAALIQWAITHWQLATIPRQASLPMPS